MHRFYPVELPPDAAAAAHIAFYFFAIIFATGLLYNLYLAALKINVLLPKNYAKLKRRGYTALSLERVKLVEVKRFPLTFRYKNVSLEEDLPEAGVDYWTTLKVFGIKNNKKHLLFTKRQWALEELEQLKNIVQKYNGLVR